MSTRTCVAIMPPQTAVEMKRLVSYLDSMDTEKDPAYYVVKASLNTDLFIRRPPSFKLRFWFQYPYEANSFARDWSGDIIEGDGE